MSRQVTVVGAGVIGLTCAVMLAEAGYRVDVLARDRPLETTSAIAGGLWLPYLAEPLNSVTRWARTTFATLAQLAGTTTTTENEVIGVRLMTGTILHAAPTSKPPWAGPLADLVPLAADADPTPRHHFGWRLRVPLVDMARYLPYLQARLEAADGTLTRLGLVALPERGIVVNCTGLAARALAADPSVHPVQGQTVIVTDPGLTQWWCEGDYSADADLRYVLPRGRDVVVGGTARTGEWSTTPDPATAERLLDRAIDIVPGLRHAAVIGHRVGLRPARPSVRLDVEHPGPGPGSEPVHAIVHCYGHGGSGITLSWGCAVDVLAAVQQLTAA